jgi:hypothetical protein
MVAVSRVNLDGERMSRPDYADHSERTPPDSALRSLVHGQLLPEASLFLDCVAVGQTVRGAIQLGGQSFAAQGVGAPPYPGVRFPRVLALLEEPDRSDAHPGITYVTGDVLDLDTGAKPVVIAHVVSGKPCVGSPRCRRRVVEGIVKLFGNGWDAVDVSGLGGVICWLTVVFHAAAATVISSQTAKRLVLSIRQCGALIR